MMAGADAMDLITVHEALPDGESGHIPDAVFRNVPLLGDLASIPFVGDRIENGLTGPARWPFLPAGFGN